MADRDRYARLERATADLQAPFALVDLEALWANASELERRAAPKPIRLASKSLRCRALQQRVLARDGFRGTLAYTLPEALWLASGGGSDLVVAYPTADASALRALAAASPPRDGAPGEQDPLRAGRTVTPARPASGSRSPGVPPRGGDADASARNALASAVG